MRSDYMVRANGELPRAIRSMRYRLGLTGRDFGKLIGVKQSVLSDYERGVCKPFLTILIHLLARASNEERPILERELSRFRMSPQELKAAAGCCSLAGKIQIENLSATAAHE